MAEKQRAEWSAVDVAEHAMEATSLSQLTLPEVKRMAARILAEERKTPKAAAEPNLREIPREEFEKGWAEYQKFVD